MFGDALEFPKKEPQNPDDASFTEEEENEDELTEDEEEEAARTVNGEICSDCGAEFTEANGTASLCQSCFETAEDLGEKHDPLSRHPVTS